jgi:hypothetical protein
MAAEALVNSLNSAFTDTGLLLHRLYDQPLYEKLGPSFTAQRRIIALGKMAPWALDGLISLASKSTWLRKKLASL